MDAFPARYRDVCFPCGQAIEPGDSITNHPDHGYIHEDCSWDADTGPQMSREPRRTSDHTTSTMPRGKTAKDRCGLCFMVHSPGQDGCE